MGISGPISRYHQDWLDSIKLFKRRTLSGLTEASRLRDLKRMKAINLSQNLAALVSLPTEKSRISTKFSASAAKGAAVCGGTPVKVQTARQSRTFGQESLAACQAEQRLASRLVFLD